MIMKEKHFELICNLASRIDGWFDSHQGKILYSAALDSPEGIFVEIGSFKGKSTVWFASAAKEKKTVLFCIDPWIGTKQTLDEGKDNYIKFLQNMISLGFITDTSATTVIPYRMFSYEAVSLFHKNISCVFIDGNHSENSVRSDFKMWYELLVPGGIMVFHDWHPQNKDGTYSWPGVRKVIDEEVSQILEYHSSSSGIWAGRKKL